MMVNHSDCDGDLTWQQCEQIWPILKEAVELLDGYDARQGMLLVESMQEAVEEKTFLEFR